MSSYDELLGTVSRIADAAIEWDMRDRGWYKVDEGWMSDVSLAPVSTYILDPTGMYLTVVGEDETHRASEFAATADTDFRAVWRGWYERINDVYRPWLSLPEPSGFDPAVNDIADAISVLCTTTSVTNGAVGETDDLESSNLDLDGALRSFCGEIIAMSGAMDTFAIAYSNRLPGVVQGQLAILAMLGCTLSAEKKLFSQLRVDVTACADDVLQVMRDQDSGGAAGELKVIGSVLAGASLFFTGGASAAVIASGRTIVGALTGFVPADEPPTEAETTYGGGTAMEVYDHVVDHLEKLERAVTSEEEIVRASLTGALGEVSGTAADAYDLSARPALLDVPDNEIVDVNTTTLAFLGGVIAPYIGENLVVARQQAAQATAREPWVRQGRIGIGMVGPYQNWLNLHDAFIDANVGTARTLTDVGTKLVDVARLYVDVDGIVQQRTTELQGFLDVPEFDD